MSVAIDPAQFRGVLPLPISALKSAFPVLGNPANRNRAIPLTYDQFRYAFANAVSEEEAKQLYETYAVPTAGKPLFQAAAANLNPWTEAKVDTKNPERGPLLIISGEMDHSVPGRPSSGPPTNNKKTTTASLKLWRSRTVVIPSPSTTAGGKSPKLPSPSSNGSTGSCSARPAPDPGRSRTVGRAPGGLELRAWPPRSARIASMF